MTKDRAIITCMLILISIVLLPAQVHAAPTLRTDQPIYTLRNTQVILGGAGYSNQPYYVWLKNPTDNRTLYTGITFTPISGGDIPQTVTLPITAQSSLGTYEVGVSTSSAEDTSQAVAHYGLWGPLKPLFQRTETVKIVGGGLFPGTSPVKISIRSPTGIYVVNPPSAVVAGADGDFNYTWRIPLDAAMGNYQAFVDGVGIFDNAQTKFLSEADFATTPATISAKITLQPSPTYQRTTQADSHFTLTYPDGSPVQTILSGTHPASLLQNQSTAGAAALTLADQSNGVWDASAKLLMNATVSTRYRFELPATSFDDGFGNKGGADDVFSDFFSVTSANLTITSSINGTQIQIPFGQVSIISKISYPDGSLLTNGTVSVNISTGSSSTSTVELKYDPVIDAWRGSYSSAFSDIWRFGTWRLQVTASDAYGNSGNTTYEVSAQPYLTLTIIIVAVFLILIGRWWYSRYGRKAYFKARKLIQRFRHSGAS